MSELHRRATLADVAELAGTSTAVVSYVVNDGPRPVAAATRERVKRAIATLGYRKNALAGALSGGHSDLVGLLVPDSSNAFFSEMAREIEREGRERGLLTLLGNTAYKRAVEVEYESAFSDLRPRGIFVTSIGNDELPPGDCPRIYLHSAPLHPNSPSVVFDDAGGGREATEHLLAHGHRAVHCVTGPNDFGPSGRRETGWRHALDDAGLQAAGLLHRVSFDGVEAEAGIRQVLLEERPKALFATTDEQALATLRVATVLGIRVPEDLAIVGFDGIREALHGSVRITTISLPLRQLAVSAFNALDRSRTSEPAEHVSLRGSLTVGDSCGCS